MTAILNPGYFGTSATGEIIYINSVTGVTATVTRAQEGTSATSGDNIIWVSGPLASDYIPYSGGIASFVNGEWPSPTASGQVFASTSTTSGVFTKSLPSGVALYPGSTGQIMVTSGTTSTWRTPQVWTSYSGGSNYNSTSPLLSNNKPAIAVAVSGYSTYIVSARARVWGGTDNGTASLNYQVGLRDTGTGAAFGTDYQGTVVTAADEAHSQEMSHFATFQPGTTGTYTIGLVVSSLTVNDHVFMNYARGSISVTGIA
jgi:hypothetical protein